MRDFLAFRQTHKLVRPRLSTGSQASVKGASVDKERTTQYVLGATHYRIHQKVTDGASLDTNWEPMGTINASHPSSTRHSDNTMSTAPALGVARTVISPEHTASAY